MENVSIHPIFRGDFLRDDIPPLTQEQKIAYGFFKSRTVNEKRRKISRLSFSYIRENITPLEEFNIDFVHLNKIEEEEYTGCIKFEILYGFDHSPLFIETVGSNSRLIRNIVGSGGYKGLHLDLESHEPEFCRLLEELGSSILVERLFNNLNVIQNNKNYKISNCCLTQEDGEYSGKIKIRLEKSDDNLYHTPAYDISQFDNPNYTNAIKTYKNTELVNGYRKNLVFDIRAIIHFSYITVTNRKFKLIPFVKEFGYSRM